MKGKAVVVWEKGVPGKDSSMCGISEFRMSLVCLKDIKKPMGLE